MNSGYSAEDLQDISLHLQGLLQIMAADNHLHELQKEKIKNYAEKFGFEKKYIESSIQSALENKYLSKIPPKFHSKSTAEIFLKEAAEIAICDGILHPNEKKWLLIAAEYNGLDISMISHALESVPLSIEKPT